MRQRNGILRIMCWAVVVFLVTFVASGARAQNLALVGYGPKFEDADFVGNFVRAINWSSLTGRIFGDEDLPVVLYPEAGEPVDNYSAPGELEDARKKLERYEGKIALLYIYVPEIAELAAEIPVELDKKFDFITIEVGSVYELTEYLNKAREEPSRANNVLVLAYLP